MLTERCLVDRHSALALALLVLLFASNSSFAGQTTFQYDNLNRLIRVNFADGSYTRYAYDNDGNRTQRITVAKPTLHIQRTPNPMVANEFFQVKWTTTGATTLGYACTAPGTGFNESGTLPSSLLPIGSASSSGAPQAWVGFDSNCLWTASGPGGPLQTSEILRTVSPVPGRPMLTVTRVPNPMVAGRRFRVDWVTTGAATLAYACTAPFPGFNGSGPLPTPNGHAEAAAAEPAWVGFPSACRWTATATNGAVTIYDESLVTIPDADMQAVAPTAR